MDNDVVISSPAPAGNNRRLFVILAVVAVAVLAAAAGVTIFLNGRRSAARQEYQTALNRYSSYILTGNVMDDFNLVPVVGDTYFIEGVVEPPETSDESTANELSPNTTEFISEAKNLLSAVKTASEKLSDTPDLTIQETNLNALQTYLENNLTIDQVRTYFAKNGASKTKQATSNKYAPLASSDNAQLAEYAELKTTSYELLVDILQEYKDASCFNDGLPDQSCLLGDSANVPQERLELLNRISVEEERFEEDDDSADTIIVSIVNRLVRNCFDLGSNDDEK